MDLQDVATFERIYAEHHASVQRTAQRVLGDAALAQDVTHDVFLRLWRNPSRFDAGRGELGSYLRLMARSRAVDLWRGGQAAGRATDRLRVVVEAEEQRDEDTRPVHNAERDADRSVIQAAMRELPSVQREAVALSYWGELTAQEIADHSGVPLGTAKSRIRLGLVKLRDAIDRDDLAAVEAA